METSPSTESPVVCDPLLSKDGDLITLHHRHHWRSEQAARWKARSVPRAEAGNWRGYAARAATGHPGSILRGPFGGWLWGAVHCRTRIRTNAGAGKFLLPCFFLLIYGWEGFPAYGLIELLIQAGGVVYFHSGENLCHFPTIPQCHVDWKWTLQKWRKN